MGSDNGPYAVHTCLKLSKSILNFKNPTVMLDRSPELTNLYISISRFDERPLLKKKVENSRGRHQVLVSGFHAHKAVCTQVNTKTPAPPFSFAHVLNIYVYILFLSKRNLADKMVFP